MSGSTVRRRNLVECVWISRYPAKCMRLAKTRCAADFGVAMSGN